MVTIGADAVVESPGIVVGVVDPVTHAEVSKAAASMTTR